MTYNQKNRKTITTRYKNKLTKLFSSCDETQRAAADMLIGRAAFLLASLDELEAIIYERGYLEEYQNGENQHGIMVSPAIKTYKLNMGQLLDVFKQLQTYLPETVEKDALTAFIDAHKN